MPSYTQEFQDHFRLWDLEAEEHSPLWAQYRSSESIRLVKEAAAKRGGLPSISAFIIAFDQLRASGAIKQVRALKPVEKDFTLTAAEYERLSANEVIRRYRNQNEPEFKAAVDALIAAGQI